MSAEEDDVKEKLDSISDQIERLVLEAAEVNQAAWLAYQQRMIQEFNEENPDAVNDQVLAEQQKLIDGIVAEGAGLYVTGWFIQYEVTSIGLAQENMTKSDTIYPRNQQSRMFTRGLIEAARDKHRR